MCCSIESFFGGSVHRSVIVRRKSLDGFWGENIGVDDVPSEIWNESYAGGYRRIVPTVFLALVFSIIKVAPSIRIGDGGQADKSSIEFTSFGGVLIIVR